MCKSGGATGIKTLERESKLLEEVYDVAEVSTTRSVSTHPWDTEFNARSYVHNYRYLFIVGGRIGEG